MNKSHDQRKKPPKRLSRLQFVWGRDPSPRYYLTICVEGRLCVFANKPMDDGMVSFLLDSPKRYQGWPTQYMLMPDHVHLIAHQGHNAIALGLWIKALKAVPGESVTSPDLIETVSGGPPRS